VYNPNYFPADSAAYETYRIRKPVNCEARCGTKCDRNGLCPEKSRSAKQISIPPSKGTLFQEVKPYFAIGKEAVSSQTYKKYLLGFDVNMQAFLTSKVSANKNILFSMSNHSGASKLKMTDIIPDSTIKYGVISVEYRGNALRFYIGGSQPNTYIAYYDFVFENFKAISKVSVELFVDGEHKNAILNIFIDDLRASYNIKTVYPPLPASSDSEIFSHPAVSNVRLNIHNPRFSYDFYLNIFNKGIFTSTFPSGLCKSKRHCEKCSFVPNSASLSCNRCQKGFIMVNSVCFGENSNTKK